MSVLIDGIHWGNIGIESWVIAAVVQAGLAAGIVLAAVRCFPRMPAPWRYTLLLIALCKFAVPPYAALPTGLFSQYAVAPSASLGIAGSAGTGTSPRPESAVQAERPSTTSSASPPPPGLVLADRSDSAANRPVGSAATPDARRTESSLANGKVRPESTGAVAVPSQSGTPVFVSMLAAIYMSGLGLGPLYLAVGLFRVYGWRRYGRSVGYASQWIDDRSADRRLARMAKKVPVLISPSVRVPMSIGFRPAILIPASLESLLDSRSPADVRKVRAVVAHELAHHARGDLWLNFLQKILLCLWWFHPMMWWLDRALAEAREDCCDDAVLNSGVGDGYTYSKTLLEIAALAHCPSERSALAIAMAHSRKSLAHRIQRVMDDSVSRHGRLSRLGWVLSIFAALVLLPGFVRFADSSPPQASSAQPTTQQGQADALPREAESTIAQNQSRVASHPEQDAQGEGRQEQVPLNVAASSQSSVDIMVLDEEANPIPQARVWRIRNAGGRLIELDPTDAEGRTQATGQAIPPSPFGHPIQFLAWNGSDRFGLASVSTKPLPKAAEITCRRHYRTPLAVHGPDGEPVEGARVAVQLGQVDGEASSWIPQSLQEKLQTTTDARGIANAFFVTSDSYLVVQVVSDPHGTQIVHLGKEDSKSAPLELQPTGRIEGQIVRPEGVAFSDVGDDYVVFTDSGGAIDTTPSVTGLALVEPDAAGRFTIPQMVAGPIRGQLRSRDGSSRWQIQPVSDIQVSPGETASVKLDVEEARKVVGTVVDGDTDEGIPGVTIVANTSSQEIWRVTNEAGEFSFFMLPGQQGSLRYFPPEAFYLTRSDYVDGGNRLKIPAQLTDDLPASSSEPARLQPYRIEPMQAKRGVTVRGTLIDESGKGIGDATVWIVWSGASHRFTHDHRSPTRADGSFAIEGVPPNRSIELSAAVHGVLLVQKELAAAPRRPLRLDVTAPKLAAFRIRVVDSEGKPMRGVRVEIHQSSYHGPHTIGVGSVFDSVTDAAGFVSTEQMHPVDKPYTIKVYAGNELLTEEAVRLSDQTATTPVKLVIDRE